MSSPSFAKRQAERWMHRIFHVFTRIKAIVWGILIIKNSALDEIGERPCKWDISIQLSNAAMPSYWPQLDSCWKSTLSGKFLLEMRPFLGRPYKVSTRYYYIAFLRPAQAIHLQIQCIFCYQVNKWILISQCIFHCWFSSVKGLKMRWIIISIANGFSPNYWPVNSASCSSFGAYHALVSVPTIKVYDLALSVMQRFNTVFLCRDISLAFSKTFHD